MLASIRPVWPDWTIFDCTLAKHFFTKVAQILSEILGYFEKRHFLVKCCGYLLGNFWKKIVLLFHFNIRSHSSSYSCSSPWLTWLLCNVLMKPPATMTAKTTIQILFLWIRWRVLAGLLRIYIDCFCQKQSSS